MKEKIDSYTYKCNCCGTSNISKDLPEDWGSYLNDIHMCPSCSKRADYAENALRNLLQAMSSYCLDERKERDIIIHELMLAFMLGTLTSHEDPW